MSTLLEKINNVSKNLSVKKDGKNPFYKSKYITLDEIMNKLQPLLDKEGLMIYNYNLKDGGVRTLVVSLENSDTVSSDFVVGDVRDPQQLGKILTYGRRYNLVSIFNILADEDDDGQSFYDEKGQPKKKYDKKIFGLKEFENLKNQKDKYTYDEVRETVHKDYSIDTDMEFKIMELYGKSAGDLF